MSEPEVERRFDSMTKDEIQLRFLLYEAIQELCYIQEYETGWPREMIATSKGKDMIERGMELLGVKDLSASCLSEFLEAAKSKSGRKHMAETRPDAAKVEVLKVWYSVFCTLVDAYRDQEIDNDQFIEKMGQLRENLTNAIPEVEAEMEKFKQ